MQNPLESMQKLAKVCKNLRKYAKKLAKLVRNLRKYAKPVTNQNKYNIRSKLRLCQIVPDTAIYSQIIPRARRLQGLATLRAAPRPSAPRPSAPRQVGLRDRCREQRHRLWLVQWLLRRRVRLRRRLRRRLWWWWWWWRRRRRRRRGRLCGCGVGVGAGSNVLQGGIEEGGRGSTGVMLLWVMPV